MTPKSRFATALVGAIVASIVIVGTLGIIGLYLANNPQILVKMGNKLERRQLEARQQKAIADNADGLFRSQKAPFAGNASGDVTVVEFFDYNCGYCRRAMPDVLKLTENDRKVRVVFKELPIFGEDSEDAAKGALAAKRQGKYLEMHQKLFTASGKANKEKVLRVADELGLDVPRLEKDMESDDVRGALDEAREHAEKLEIRGTPYYLIGDRIIGGFHQDLYDRLVKEVAQVRERG